MFNDHFGFVNTPFARTITAPALYHSPDFVEAVNRLKYGATNRLFMLLIGDSGTGKTTSLRWLSDELSKTKCRVLYVCDSQLTPRTFYRAILEQLGFEPKYGVNDAKRQLYREAEILMGVHDTVLVTIVDEAHLLSKDMLEEIRFTLNYKMDSQSPTALILCGQSELWDKKLKLESYAAIRQRIDFQCVLYHFDRSQTAEYIAAHLKYAGADREIFTDSAIDAIYKFSTGIARLINKVASSTLIYAAQSRKHLIDDHMVKLIIESELQGGVAE